MPLKILLAGATGQLGSRIARELLSRRLPVRVLCRPTSASGALRRMGAEIVTGDLKDPASLAAACVGVDAVLTTANSVRRTPPDTIEAVDLMGTRALIDAAAAAGVGHFVYMSDHAVSAPTHDPYPAAKAASEVHLQASGMPWTILAPDAFMESWPGRIVGQRIAADVPVVLVGDGVRKHSYIAEHDVAQLAVAALIRDVPRNRRLAVGGPDAHSWLDVVAAYERVLGQSIDVRHVGVGERIDGVPETDLARLALYETFDSVFNSSAVFAELDVPQTPLESWVRAAVASMRRRM